MAGLTAFVAQHLETFLLVFFRLGGMLAVVPVLGHRSIPVPHRAGLAALLALVLTPLVAPSRSAGIPDGLALALAVAGELFVGLAIGLVAQLTLAAVQVAGELVGFQMGLTIAGLFDPATGQEGSVFARFQDFFALLLFLTLNGHHLLIQVVAASFERIRPGGLVFQPAMAAGVASLGGPLVRSGFELAAPLVGILFVLNVAMALLARVAPQTNVFMLGVPLTVGFGIFGLVETFPYFAGTVARLISDMAGTLDAILLGTSYALR